MNKREATDAAENKKTWRSLIPVISLKLVLISMLFLTALLSFAVIAHEVVSETEADFDQRLFRVIGSYTNPGLIRVMTAMTFFGSSAFLLPAYTLLILYFLFTGQRRTSINIAVIALSSTGMLHLLKRLFRRDRPDLPLIHSLNTYSFPSGHALSSFIFSMIVIHLIWKTKWKKVWKWIGSSLLLLFALLVGLSRVILKMHYASDVIAGFCLGLVWVLLSFSLLERIENKNAAMKQA